MRRATQGRADSLHRSWLILQVVLAISLVLQTAAADPLEEIVVTARRVPERLADVPLAIDVFAGDDLAAGAIDSMQALMARAPGLYYETTWGGRFSAPNLRGQQASPTGDVNVGVFVDGVYQANPAAVDPGILDFERIEIARGPQSTLFGHSTFAGAIHYVTAAPSATLEHGLTLDVGSGDQAGVRAFISGPLLDGGVLGRLAVGLGTFSGTHDNSSPSGGDLAGWRRTGAALSLATPDGDGARAGLNVRFDRKYADHPAVSALTYVDYNCGAVEALSGAWSYFCGDLPLRSRFEISPGIPDSESEVLQTSLVLEWPIAGGQFESRTSFYRGSTDSYRDFDVSGDGEAFGVCTLGVNCDGPIGVPRNVNRLASANEVSRALSTVEEWSQEFRWQTPAGERLAAMIGATAWWTQANDEARLGVQRGDLANDERLTALLPRSPLDVGPVSLVNRALVDDPNALQRIQSLNESERRTLALFGGLDYALTPRVQARAELRVTRERRTLDNQVANFAPGFGTAIKPQYFDDVTPRFSVQYAPSETVGGYVSAAKGSQSGGINAIPGLLADEQVYDPEFNWTYEVGGRYRSPRRKFGLRTTLYYIDWRNMQLLGFPDTAGIANLITRNTSGLRTRGLEASLDARLHSAVRAELDLSYTDPEFRRGSDDPGSRRFCGISATNSTSTFCTVGPARSGDVAGLVLVPYIDGNMPGRTPRRMWHAGMVIEPPSRGGQLLVFRVDVNGQDDVFDRAIGGARFGSRVLLDSRLSYHFGDWSVTLWGSNLSDAQYIRALASRGQVFFPTTPRPLDKIHGDGRRIGLSVSYARRPD